jgi:predicted HicB family RNase H-like nuclease
MKSKKKQRRLLINVDPRTHRALKIEAAKRTVTLRELVDQLVREWLKAGHPGMK